MQPQDGGVGARGDLKILVVDDDAVSRRVAVEFLEQLGHAADTASDGEEALEAALKTRYDLVLMDCDMPRVDGYEATRRLRAHEAEQGHRAHIVALTGSVSFDDEQRCFKAGMDAYVGKPIKKRRLSAILDSLSSGPGSKTE